MAWGATRWQRSLAAVLAALIFSPQWSVDAIVGLDPSWEAGLALAQIRHLSWGPELVFTYGPLGFLQTTAYYSFNQSLLATIYQLIVVAALFLGVAAALRHHHAATTSLIGAFIVTGIVAILHIGPVGAPGMRYPELAVLAAFAWAAESVLRRDPRRWPVFTTCIGLGAVAGLQLLVKFNTGLAIAAIALALSVLRDWKAVGRHCATVATFAAFTIIWWLITGQRLGDLPTWLRSSAGVVSGYVEMAIPLPPPAVIAVGVTLAWVAALCVMFLRGGPEIPRSFVTLVGLATVYDGRIAFGHFTETHFYYLLGLIVVAVAITPLPGIRGRMFIAVTTTIVFACIGVSPGVYYRAVAAMRGPAQAIDRLVTLAVPGRLDQRIQQAKARQRALYDIPETFIQTIGASTVHIDPYETSAVWAYDLSWRPTPVFQTYTASTPGLDNINSDVLADGPKFVLSRRSSASPAVDVGGRLGVQESPRYSLALLCNYTLSGVEGRWALFTRSKPHCGPATALSQVDVPRDGTVTVPAPTSPDMAVLVGVDLKPTVLDRLFQGNVASLTISTDVLDGVTYRLVIKNAPVPFLLNTPMSVDGTNLQIHAHTVGVGRTPSLGQSAVNARLRFYEMRVER
ncbi:hypothetical protein [Mycobacterium sp.]|uniref:hypothetical protein n=1 Tax=Mycobacterium sp. TaxID=1785 RepID=UPI0025CC561B|nr:hypothetical protein [Mycobacterium sp.]